MPNLSNIKFENQRFKKKNNYNNTVSFYNNGKRIGTMNLNLSPNRRTLNLSYLYTNENYRGQGLGKFLVKSLVNAAKKAGFKHVNAVAVHPASARIMEALGGKLVSGKLYRINLNRRVNV